MQMRTAAACLSLPLTLAVSVAESSEGLKYAGAYMCDPVRVTLATTKVCISRLSGKSDEYTNAYHRWLKRNESDISRLKDECRSQARRIAPDEVQFSEIMRQVDQINAEAIVELSKRDAKSTEVLCADLLSGMKTGKSDLNQYFPPKK